MVSWTNLAAQIWRDYVTDGIPSSGKNNPDKGEIRTWGTEVESNLTNMVGAVMPFAMATAPTGWLACDGAAVSRTTYAALFTAIGTTFGVGDGSTTFNLPDLQDEFVRGVSGTRAVGTTEAGAVESHLHTVNPPLTATTSNSHTHSGTTSSDSHSHTGTTSSDTHSHNYNRGQYISKNHSATGTAESRDVSESSTATTSDTHSHTFTTSSDSHSHTYTTSSNSHSHNVDIAEFNSGSTGGSETRPQNVALLYCIKT